MSAVQASFGTGRYAAGEEDAYFSLFHGGGTGKPTILIAHQHGTGLNGMMAGSDNGRRYYVDLATRLAEDFVVGLADLGGGATWANPASTGILSQQRAYLQSVSGWTGKVGLIGVSMGGGLVLNWTKSNPGQSAFVAGVLPMVNLNDLRFYDSHGTTNWADDTNAGSGALGDYGAEINAAYGGSYTDASKGSISNPYYYRSSYPASAVRTALWTTPGDTVVRNQWADALVVAQPSVERYLVTDGSGGGLNHTEAAIAGAFYGDHCLSVLDWCRRRLSDSF